MSDTDPASATTTIDASTETVWDALTDPGTVEQWFFGSTVETDGEVGRPIDFRGG